ncbi:MAG: hypothetical protein PHS09_01350 [Candidatus Omnitrophica bacterium]|nr:hypothetical protein [Candidatus Omnitrophota bacterium]MDD5513519.1 hypothetical protein [Candidatus Omnitrophota bacterium]
MNLLGRIFIYLGAILLIFTALIKIFGQPHFTMGVKIISLLLLSNTCFLLAIIIKFYDKTK